MISKYSIIQYFPDVLSEEIINIGVIVFNNEKTLVDFVSNWHRVKAFSQKDISFLRDFASDFRFRATNQLSLPGSNFGPILNESLVIEITKKWNNSIQLSPPRTSLEPLEKLLETICLQYLKSPISSRREYRDKRGAASIAKDTFKKALEEHAGKSSVEKYFHPQHEITGKYGAHTFDVVIMNGYPKIAVQGISFELPEATLLNQSVDATAFQVIDTREKYKSLPIGILALPPKSTSHPHIVKIYDRARFTYEGLKVEVFEEKDATQWALEKVKAANIE
jgi:hypothetical protein